MSRKKKTQVEISAPESVIVTNEQIANKIDGRTHIEVDAQVSKAFASQNEARDVLGAKIAPMSRAHACNVAIARLNGARFTAREIENVVGAEHAIRAHLDSLVRKNMLVKHKDARPVQYSVIGRFDGAKYVNEMK